MMRWLGAVTIFIAIMTGTVGTTEQPQVKVQGTLKGYFLASDGTLDVYEVPFATDNAPSADLPSRLYPLWAGYYLQATIQSSKPFQSLWLLSGNGRLLWRQHYPEGETEAEIPPLGWLSLKGQDGLYLRLLVRFVDGEEKLIRCQFPCRFERVLPLKVDWLDFVRIAEVSHLLELRGRKIWEGFSLDGIPFLLEGDEGQWVLINHPKPPKGFVRYEGPLPKVPLKMTVYIGQGHKMWYEEWDKMVAGRLGEINGVLTAILRYYPYWWVIPDYAPLGYEVTRSPDAIDRLETIIHEAFHVFWFGNGKKIPTEDNLPPEDQKVDFEEALKVSVVERECLARSLVAVEEKERNLWVKAFLEQRKIRRRLEGADAAKVASEQSEEMVEGLATFVSLKAIEVASEDYEPIPQIYADVEFSGYDLTLDLTLKKLCQLLRQEDNVHFKGAAQAFLLSKMRSSWQREVREGKTLEELLTEMVKDVGDIADLLSEAEQFVREKFQEVQQTLEKFFTRKVKPPVPHVLIWLYLPKDLIYALRQFEKFFGTRFFDLRVHPSSPDEMSIRVSPPVWVVFEGERIGILWDVRKQLMVLHRPDGIVTLKGDGLEVEGKIEVTWDENGVHVRPANKLQKAKRDVLVTRKKSSYAVVLPVALLSAIAQRSFGAGQEAPTIIGTITGMFFNQSTGQYEMATFSLPNELPLCDEEEYLLELQVNNGSSSKTARLGSERDFVIFGFSLTYNFDVPREPCSYPGWEIKIVVTFKSGPHEIRFGVEKSNEAKVYAIAADPIGKEIGRIEIGLPPEKGQLPIKALLGDAEKEGSKYEPLAALVDLWYRQESTGRWIKKNTDRVNLNGELLLCNALGGWKIIGYKGEPIPACPQDVAYAEVCESQPGLGSAHLIFWIHKPITGQVMELTRDGKALPLSEAQVYLFKGDQQLSGPWRSDKDGYFSIPPFEIDAILNQHGSGTYTVKVIPPARSMMKPVPQEKTKNVDLTKCERLNQLDECPRALTVDLGAFCFSYEPAFPGPGS